MESTQAAGSRSIGTHEAVSALDGTARRKGVRVQVSDLEKTFRRASGELVRAIDKVSLEVEAGEMLVLLGPSGCGKTTLLRCFAGVEHPNSGEIRIGEKVMSSTGAGQRIVFVPPEKRRLSMIFQSYALWPHMTAFANVAYPLRVRGKSSRDQVDERVRASLKLVGIPELAKQHPTAMSGGQQQRVALARAIVGGDELVLFDEPLSNVDAKVREELRFEIMEMHSRLGFTGIYVTHDQHEAMAIATRIAVMQEGKVAQLGTPREVYERPESRYVATFVGTTNELAGKIVERAQDRLVVDSQIGKVTAGSVAVQQAEVSVGDEVTIVSRPENWNIVGVGEDAATEGENLWAGTVNHIQFAGSYRDVSVAIGDTMVNVWIQQLPPGLKSGDRVIVTVPATDARIV